MVKSTNNRREFDKSHFEYQDFAEFDLYITRKIHMKLVTY